MADDILKPCCEIFFELCGYALAYCCVEMCGEIIKECCKER